jgi:hypothetical protein
MCIRVYIRLYNIISSFDTIKQISIYIQGYFTNSVESVEMQGWKLY